jgi:RIO kinase 1
MRVPESLVPLLEYGIVEDVVRPLMSGKEAQVYIVVSGGQYAVAKVYKEAQNRSFRQRAEYTEGRKVRNSRDQRAMDKRSKHGRAQDEAAWRSTEVDMIHRLHAAGVRVPTPRHFVEGVLIMDLILDEEGQPAPRLADLHFTPERAQIMFDLLLREVVRMLCAGVVHGDLSDFNVLVDSGGPVIIDFPQSVDTARNSSARKLLIRDVDNLHRFLQQYVPHARRLPYAEEMWELFQNNAITPDTRLTGRYRPAERRVDTKLVMDLIQDANYDERKRRDSLGLRGGPQAQGERPQQQQRPPRAQAPGQPHGSAPGQRQPQGQRPAQGPRPSQGQGQGQHRQHGPRPHQPQGGRPQHPPQQSAPSQGGGQSRGRRPPPAHASGGNGGSGQNRGNGGGGNGNPRDERRPPVEVIVRRPPSPRS